MKFPKWLSNLFSVAEKPLPHNHVKFINGCVKFIDGFDGKDFSKFIEYPNGNIEPLLPDDVWLPLPPPWQDILAYRNLRKREFGNQTYVFKFHDPTRHDEYEAFLEWVGMTDAIRDEAGEQ